MKISWKILLTIALAALTFWVSQLLRPIEIEHVAPSAIASENLNSLYAIYNNVYFDDKLPKNVVIDWAESGDYMASTMKMSNGRFHIAFNEKYVAAERVRNLTMLHEQCHVKTWGQSADVHGGFWRACMLQLDMQGAFRMGLIDGYRE